MSEQLETFVTITTHNPHTTCMHYLIITHTSTNRSTPTYVHALTHRCEQLEESLSAANSKIKDMEERGWGFIHTGIRCLCHYYSCVCMYVHAQSCTHVFRIRLPTTKSKQSNQSETSIVEANQESRHTSRIFTTITADYDSRHITCVSHLRMFVNTMSSSTSCVRKMQDGYVCGGSYRIHKIVRKGVGGELLAQAICSRCNFTVRYGDPKFSPSSARPRQMTIGHELMLSYILLGRPLHTLYKKLFGSIGMDTFSDKTFQIAVKRVADAVDKRQRFEVIIHTISNSCINF